MPILARLKTALAARYNATVPAASTPHVCTSACLPDGLCRDLTTIYQHGPIAVPDDHILIHAGVNTQTGARHIHSIPATSLATIFASIPDGTPLTLASLKAAVLAYEQLNNVGAGASGFAAVLDAWRADGTISS